MKRLATVIRVPNETPNQYLSMPEGLEGYWWETEHVICVPLVIAHEPHRFAPWLTSIQKKGKLVFFPTVISEHLAAMLIRRGYQQATVHDKQMGKIDGFARQF